MSGDFDVNGDGVSDIVIGAPEGGTTGALNGEAYVVFGQVSYAFPLSMHVSPLLPCRRAESNVKSYFTVGMYSSIAGVLRQIGMPTTQMRLRRKAVAT